MEFQHDGEYTGEAEGFTNDGDVYEGDPQWMPGDQEPTYAEPNGEPQGPSYDAYVQANVDAAHDLVQRNPHLAEPEHADRLIGLAHHIAQEAGQPHLASDMAFVAAVQAIHGSQLYDAEGRAKLDADAELVHSLHTANGLGSKVLDGGRHLSLDEIRGSLLADRSRYRDDGGMPRGDESQEDLAGRMLEAGGSRVLRDMFR